MKNSATFDLTKFSYLNSQKASLFWLHVNANVKRSDFIIYYSIPIIQYIVFLRLIYEENVCLFPRVQHRVSVEALKVAMKIGLEFHLPV